MSEKKPPKLTRKGTMKVTVDEAAELLKNPHLWEMPEVPKPVAEDKKGGDTDEEKEAPAPAAAAAPAKDEKKRKSTPKKKKAPAKKKVAKPRAFKVEIAPPRDVSLAYELAGLLVLDRLSEADRGILSAMKETDLVIVQGAADQTEKVAAAVKVPSKSVIPADFDSLSLPARATCYVNCMATFTPAGVKKLADFVESGGLVVTTDHAISEVEKAFPGMIAQAGATSDTSITVQVTSFSHPVLSGFFDEDVHPKWRMAGGSWGVRVVATDKVETLLKSAELSAMCGGNDSVVVTFPWGKGRVYHMTSHFYLQGSASFSEMTSSEYAKRKMASEALIKRFEEEEAKPGTNLQKGTVQAAATSIEFLIRSIIDHIRSVEAPAAAAAAAAAPSATSAPPV